MRHWLSPLRTVLNADTLRRLAMPLRTLNPRLYSLANGVRKRVLTAGSDLAAYQANAVARFSAQVDLNGARVLEIGSDLDLLVLRRFADLGAAEAIGVNNSADLWKGRHTREIRVDGARLIDADASNLPFPDANFDCVFSVAVFEHLLDLRGALAEMRRVLAPGGTVYAAFGPIWSGCKGHHISIKLGDEELRHFIPEKNPLPDFSHLLLGPEQMRAALRHRFDAEWVDAILEYVYFGKAINRLFYHEYLDEFAQCGLHRRWLKPERDLVAPQLRRILELTYPGERDFDVTNAEVILVKQ